MLKNVVQNKFIIWCCFLHHCQLQLKNVKYSKLVLHTLKLRTSVIAKFDWNYTILFQIISAIQQVRNDAFQSIPSLLNETNCPDVYIIKSLFTHKFFEELLFMANSVFDVNSMNFIHLSEMGFVEDWQTILNFFIVPELDSNFFGHQNIEGTFMIRKYSNNDTEEVYDTINSHNLYNIWMPLSPGGEISFKR